VPKFQVEVSFDLSTTIEFDADVYHALDTSEVEDFEDNSYFSSQEIDSSGGEVSFMVEAEDEDDAERMAYDVVSEGAEVEDSSGITWGVTNVHVSVEEIKVEMTLERATEILETHVTNGEASEEVTEAIQYVLAHIASLSAKVAAIEAQLAETQRSLAEVKASMPTPTVPTTLGYGA
jgi:hypothetical protein